MKLVKTMTAAALLLAIVGCGNGEENQEPIANSAAPKLIELSEKDYELAISEYHVVPDQGRINGEVTVERMIINRSKYIIDNVVASIVCRQYPTKKILWESKTQPIYIFDSESNPLKGALMPDNLSYFVIKDIAKMALWRSDTGFEVSIKKVYGREDVGDIYDPINMCQWLKTEKLDVITKKLDSDDVLMKRQAFGLSMVHFAILMDRIDVLDYLLAKGAKLDGKEFETAPPILAAQSDSPEMLKKVESLGFSLNKGYGPERISPLQTAVATYHNKSADWLIAHKVDLNLPDINNTNALFAAASQGNGTAVDKLVKAGAKVNVYDKQGMNVLFYCRTCSDMVSFLVKKGLQPDETKMKNGMTALMSAAKNQSYDLAIELLKNGADINAKDKDGLTVYDYAKQSNTLGSDEFFRNAVTGKQ